MPGLLVFGKNMPGQYFGIIRYCTSRVKRFTKHMIHPHYDVKVNEPLHRLQLYSSLVITMYHKSDKPIMWWELINGSQEWEMINNRLG